MAVADRTPAETQHLNKITIAALADHLGGLFVHLTTEAAYHGWSLEEVRGALEVTAGDGVAEAWMAWSS